MLPKIFKNYQKNDSKKQPKKQTSTKHDKPVLVSEREARLRRRTSSAIPPLTATHATTRHGVSVYLCLHSKRHWIPQHRHVARCLTPSIAPRARSLRSLARCARSTRNKERERARERERKRESEKEVPTDQVD